MANHTTPPEGPEGQPEVCPGPGNWSPSSSAGAELKTWCCWQVVVKALLHVCLFVCFKQVFYFTLLSVSYNKIYFFHNVYLSCRTHPTQDTFPHRKRTNNYVVVFFFQSFDNTNDNKHVFAILVGSFIKVKILHISCISSLTAPVNLPNQTYLLLKSYGDFFSPPVYHF